MNNRHLEIKSTAGYTQADRVYGSGYRGNYSYTLYTHIQELRGHMHSVKL